MLIDYARRLAFIHVPRTAGVAITLWWARHAASVDCLIDLSHERHLTASDMLARAQAPVRLFTVYRSLADIRTSIARLVRRDEQHLARLREPWRTCVARCEHVPDQDVLEALWPRDGKWTETSWWSHWLDATEPIEMLDYRRLDRDWEAFCRRHHLPCAPLWRVPWRDFSLVIFS